MDQLLSTFYQTELPAELKNLPSTWPEVMRQPADHPGHPAPVTLRASESAATPATGRPASTAGRGIVVAVATLATCLMIMALSQSGSTTSTPDGFATPVEPQDRNAPGALIDVSANPGSADNGELDENGTTIDEVDQISIEAPLPKKKNKTQPDQ